MKNKGLYLKEFDGAINGCDLDDGKKMKEVISLNNAEQDKSICHSHDFCDANMFMGDGFKAATGRNPKLNVDADCALWNAAWDIAKSNGFYKPKSKRPY